MEQWQISRAGIVNFWYYDDEEFIFEDGRLLLRGANGSGKSVTMQSLLPLLFDGNKSPERLDPFGSRARRMESYLLSDGLDVEERTGYLYLEFAKPESQRYLSIGMGMRARQNMPLQAWYFILLDNRRIGPRRDLSLYKEVGDKIPLTHKELENRIGQGGFITGKQGEYKEKVNEYLFGYQDLTDFDELIELLIQIRSPKLSKEFKPTTMYEIMQNSLVTLTEEDLRPMSEAIENMDEVKAKIEALVQSKRAIGRIDYAYAKYNRYVLAQKAKRYTEWKKKAQAGIKREQELTGQLQQELVRRDSLGEQIVALDDEAEELRQAELRLKEHDLSRLANEKITIEGRIKELGEKLAGKQRQLDKAVADEVRMRGEARDKAGAEEVTRGQIEALLVEMHDVIGDVPFDEHAFFVDEYRQAGEQPYSFAYHSKETDAYLKKLRAGYEALRRLEDARGRYEEQLALKDEKARALDEQGRRVVACEGQFNEIKEEFAEKIFAWAGQHPQLTMEKALLSEVVERAYRYGAPWRWEEVIQPVRSFYEDFRSHLLTLTSELSGQQKTVHKELALLQAELARLEDQQEMEPPRSGAVVENRRRLSAAGIPFVPLYKALDFAGELADPVRNTLEEALLDLGLLDALIIPPEHYEAAMAMDPGLADKYLLAEPKIMCRTLSQYLKPDLGGLPLDFTLVEDVVRSVLLQSSPQGAFVSPDGVYGMGIVTGKVSRDVDARYIGYQARQRYKARLIAEAEAAVQEAEGRLSRLAEQMAELTGQLAAGEKAWAVLPGNQDLAVALQELEEAQRERKALQEELERAGKAATQAYQLMQQWQLTVHEKTKGIGLALRGGVYQVSIEAMDGYKNLLRDLIICDKSWRHLLEALASLRERLEDHAEILEDLRYEGAALERETRQASIRLDNILEELQLGDYQAFLARLEGCRDRLAVLPRERGARADALADCKAQIMEKERAKAGNQLELEQSRRMQELYQWAFAEEWKLGYGGWPELAQSLEEQAKAVLEADLAVLEEGKTVVDFRDALKESYLKELGELAEYNLQSVFLFKELPVDDVSEDDRIHIERIDIVAKSQGHKLGFYELRQIIDEKIAENSSLLDEQDRALFEEILIKSVSRKISSKIYHSEQWVRKIDELMSSMNTSSGLSFNLRWVTRAAQSEEQLSTRELVDILRGDQGMLTLEQKSRMIAHFRSKIQETRNRLGEEADQRSFLAIMKEILDYRKWFEFQLYFTKTGERKKELTNNAFFALSGGEKAMAMYVPLFSAVYAKYQGGRGDCPKVISLDEAFAGVDEKNIEDMFRLLVELKLSFIANSQVIFGDYATVPGLGIYELIRPENVTYVTVIRYRWNGRVRQLVGDEEND